jgi:hypothetical protein
MAHLRLLATLLLAAGLACAAGCRLWLALLLMNAELAAPGLDLILPDITKACPMFFPWTAESARTAPHPRRL